MPITIQELVASDTISQAVDKINFNFDHLLLNGGGPAGPIGPTGPTGPIGSRGIRGTQWFEDVTAFPGVAPTGILFTDLEDGDNYLQSNGDVWEWNGTAWAVTGVNLRGPEGPTGSSAGFSYFGGFPGTLSIDNENVIHPSPMPNGISAGANQSTNQGIPAVLIGGVASNATAPSTITFDSSFLLNDTMSKSLDSSRVSLMIHKKDSSSTSIKFMGGGEIPSQNYEQSDIDDLSSIDLGIDDSLIIDIPKEPSNISLLGDLIGFTVNTLHKGQLYYSGKNITLTSGNSAPSGFQDEISDISIQVGTSNSNNPGKFSVSTILPAAESLFEVGGRITLVNSTNYTGDIFGEANRIHLVGKSYSSIQTAAQNYWRANQTGVLGLSSNGLVELRTLSSQNIFLNSDNDININSRNPGDSINISGTYINLADHLGAGFHRLRADNSSTSTGGFKFYGNITYSADSFVDTEITSHRNIFIFKDSSVLSDSSFPVALHSSQSTNSNNSGLLKITQGSSYATSAKYSNLYAGGIDLHSTVTGDSGLVGFKLTGRDTVSGNLSTRFHAKRDTTSIYNRLQYIKKDVNINPLTGGYGTDLSGYTISDSLMDCSFLRIYIGYNGGLVGSANLSSDPFDIILPAGEYVGQKLIVYMITGKCSLREGSTTYTWTGTANLKTFYDNQITTLISISVPDGDFAEEVYLELTWIGEEFTFATVDVGNPSNLITKSGERGWVVTQIGDLGDSYRDTIAIS